MNPDEIKQWLEPEEWEDYKTIMGQEKTRLTYNYLEALERLAASRERSEQRRELMEKYPPAEINEPDYKEWQKAIEKGE